jgi:Tfp pilus assembly protein PilO
VSQNRTLLAVVGTVLAAAAFWFLVLSPKREEATTLRADVDKARQNLQAAKQLLATHQQAKATYKEAYASVVRLGKAVPADDDVRSLMVQLDAAADRAGVDFRSIQVGGAASAPADPGKASSAQLPPGATVGPAGFPMMPFNFTFQGSFFRLEDFFNRLERFVTARNQQISVTGRLLTLESLKLEPSSEGFPKIKATVGATSYLVSPLEGITGGATPQGPAAPQTQASAPGTAGSTAAPTTTATTTGAIR